MATITVRQRVGWSITNIVVIVWCLFPVVWILSLSFKMPRDYADGSYWPRQFTWQNYVNIFQLDEFTRGLINSIGISLISTAIAIVFGTMAAYAVARLDFPGKSVLIGLSLLVAIFPQISLVTPLYQITRTLGIFDTWPALIIPYVTFALPLSIYILSSFFREIPWELEKAAKMDGATPTQAFLKVIAPLAMPGVVTTAIIVFITCWNDFLYALTLTSTNRSRTVPAAMAYFHGTSIYEQPVTDQSAAAIVITVPIILFVMFFQRRIVAGLTNGAVKG